MRSITIHIELPDDILDVEETIESTKKCIEDGSLTVADFIGLQEDGVVVTITVKD